MAVKISDDNNIPKLIEKMSGMKNRKIEAGVLEDGEQAMIAFVHEYGMDIAVTPRMRAYLHYQGIHLRKDTTHIRIPERSFIRSGWDENEADIHKKIEYFFGDVLDLNIDAEVFLDKVGKEMEGKLKKHLVELSSPPLSDWTTEKKSSSNPLVDTGSLLDSISYEVK